MFIWMSKPWEAGEDTHWSHLKIVLHFGTYPWLPLCVMTGRRSRWRNLASSKLINVKLPAQALLAFLLIIPVSALILLKHDSLSNIPASLHTESNFNSAKDFNLLVSHILNFVLGIASFLTSKMKFERCEICICLENMYQILVICCVPAAIPDREPIPIKCRRGL